MKNQTLIRVVSAGALMIAMGAASAQSTNLTLWTRAGDAQVSSSTAVLTTAASDSGETPLSGTSALPYYDLEPALSILGATAADTYEGSGLRQSFAAAAGTTLSFNWSLSTVNYAAAASLGLLDRAFVVVDGTSALNFATIAASTVSGSYSYTFAAGGSHSFAIVVMDVNDFTLVSTLTVSNLQVSAVPEPASVAMLLAGLGLVGGAAVRRRKQ